MPGLPVNSAASPVPLLPRLSRLPRLSASSRCLAQPTSRRSEASTCSGRTRSAKWVREPVLRAGVAEPPTRRAACPDQLGGERLAAGQGEPLGVARRLRDRLGCQSQTRQPGLGGRIGPDRHPRGRPVGRGQRRRLNGDREVIEPGPLPRPIADRDDGHRQFGQRQQRRRAAAARDAARPADHQPGTEQRGFPAAGEQQRWQRSIGRRPVEVDAQALQAGGGEGGRSHGHAGGSGPGVNPRDRRASRHRVGQYLGTFQHQRHRFHDQRADLRVDRPGAQQVCQHPFRHAESAAQPRSGTQFHQPVPDQPRRTAQPFDARRVQRADPGQFEGQRDRHAGGTAAVQPCDRERQIAVEIGGRGNDDQFFVDVVQPERLRQRVQRIGLGRSGRLRVGAIILARDRQGVVEFSPGRRIQSGPPLGSLLEQRWQCRESVPHPALGPPWVVGETHSAQTDRVGLSARRRTRRPARHSRDSRSPAGWPRRPWPRPAAGRAWSGRQCRVPGSGFRSRCRTGSAGCPAP